MQRTSKSLVVLFAAAFFAGGCANRQKPTFVERCTFEITDSMGSWSIKQTWGLPGASCGPRVSILSANSMILDAFYPGTLLVAGYGGFSLRTQVVREQYNIKCTYKFDEGTTIQIQKEGKVESNLNFVQNGTVVTDFGVNNASGRTIVSNSRTIEVRNGRVQSVSFEDATKPQELLCQGGKRVDLKTMAFDVK
jgi:hypothetical protein